MALNKMRFHNVLVRKMDIPSDVAEELAEIVDDANNDLAPRSEFELLRSEIRADLAEIRELIWRVTLILVGAMTMGFSVLAGIGIALLARSG